MSRKRTAHSNHRADVVHDQGLPDWPDTDEGGRTALAVVELLAEWSTVLRHRQGLSTVTVRNYTTYVRAFLLDNRGWRRMDTPAMERWLDGRRNRRGQRLSPSSRAQWAIALGHFGEWAVERGYRRTNPAAELSRPKGRAWQPRPLDDVDRLLLLAAVDPATPVGRACLLMVHAGFRCSDVSGLYWSDLDLGRMVWIVRHGKGDKRREVPVLPELLNALGAPGPRSEPVIGASWTAQTVSHKVGDYLRGLGINATPHQLRHTFATRAHEAFPDVVTLASVLGHANIATTQHYVHVTAEKRDRMMAALAALNANDAGLRVGQHPAPASPRHTGPARVIRQPVRTRSH